MKARFLVTSMVAALYSAGVVSALDNKSGYSIKAIDIDPDVIKQRTKAQATTSDYSNLLEGFGRNVQIKQGVKFTPEANITGQHNYIIQFYDAPAVLYTGDQNGRGATREFFKNHQAGPRKNNLKNNAVVASYTQTLKSKQDAFVSKAAKQGIHLKVKQNFQVALNAITAKLTQQEAEALSKLSDVAYVSRDKHNELLMDVAPERTNVPAVWNNTEFAQAPNGLKGEGMLIGVIDTGINTQHPSFAAVGGDGYQVQNPLGSGNFLHDCTEAGQETLCNDKLIGVWSTDVITQAFSDPEFEQSRAANGEDYQGHGSHTASIAAGNVLYNVPYKIPALAVTNEGIETGLTLPEISGIAPHANIISYQVCYPGVGGQDKWIGCPESATVAAIEQAIIDGVDVINYSISGGHDPHNNPVELAFLSAHEANINVAASAGNAGAYQTVNHVSPWLLSVGSTETGRSFNVPNYLPMTLSGGNPDFPANNNLPGTSYSRAYGYNLNEISGPMVLASNYGNELCDAPFAAGTFTNNEIVFCARGTNPLVEKSDNAAAGGAQAVVIYNTPNSDTAIYTNIPYETPTFQVQTSESSSQYSQDMVDWLNDGTGHMGTIPVTEGSTRIVESSIDRMSVFSSKGHAYLTKYRESTAPSIVAPGTDIYSAFSADQPFTLYPSPTEFNAISGTSMSSPHIAGALALIKQARPEWSPSEVMSALQLTANDSFGPRDTNPWIRGSGIAQVDKAIQSGLIMHVPSEHYAIANPHSGGNLGALNTPNMVDDSCFKSCSWVREVTATVDGTWNVEGITGEYSVQVEASPSQFTLQAGETQRILITGSWVDSRNAYESPRGLTVFGKLRFSHNSADIPAADMNVEMVLNSGELPEFVDYTVHNKESRYTLNNLFFGNAPELQAKVYQPAQANIEQIELVERENGNGANLFEATGDTTGVEVRWIDVPENAKRLVAEVLSSGAAINPNEYTDPIGNAGIYLGYDADNNGEIDYDNEVICKSVISSSDLLDWCNVPNPNAGSYWVVFQEHNFNSGARFGFEEAIFSHQISTAVVTGDEADNITINAPASTVAEEMVSVEILSQLSELVEGDKVYTAIEFGTDNDNPNNLGTISANISRGKDELSLTKRQSGAVVGDEIDYTISVMANRTGADRAYTFSTEIPEGLELVEGSVQLSDNRYLTPADISQQGNQLTISGLQADSRDFERQYQITNSMNDEFCGTPIGDGSYIDLNSYGFNPVESAPSINLGAPMQLSFSEIYQDARSADEKYALYHYYDSDLTSAKTLLIHSNGMVNFTGMWHPLFAAANYAFNDDIRHFIPSSLGVFWTGAAGFASFGMQSGAPYSLDDNGDGVSGITFVSLVDENNTGSHLVVEWDNIQFVTPVYDRETRSYTGTPNPEAQSKVDAQLILARDYNSADGAYEMVYAYDNLNFDYFTGNGSPFQEIFAFENNAVAGIHSFASPWAGQPLDGDINQSIIPGFDGFGGLNEFLQNNMAVCFDYQGPEVTAFDVNFKVKVKPEAIGQSMVVNIDADVAGTDQKILNDVISIQSNLTLWDIDDQVTDENTAIEGIEVAYMDNNNVSNVISVNGEGFTANINGHTSGSTFDIVPDADWHGTTDVTVTVTDANYSSDAVSTSFKLTVNSDGIEKGCTDPGATNFDPNANSNDGSCVFPEEPAAATSSGGSLAWFMFTLVILAGLRRR